MGMLNIRVEWDEEDPTWPAKVTLVLVEGGRVEELNELRCAPSAVPSEVCELLHDMTGSSTLSGAGASG